MVSFWKKISSSFKYYKRLISKQPHILRNLDNPPGVFYSVPVQLATKEYLTYWKIIYVYKDKKKRKSRTNLMSIAAF